MNIEVNTNNLNDAALSTEMFLWILHNFPKDSTILELGSGTGTIELSKHYKVYSVEQDKNWLNLAKDSTYIHAPIINNWYDSNILFENIPSEYDLLLVDGPSGTGNRNGIQNYWDQFNTDIPIVMDDTHRLAEYNFAFESAEILNKKITIVPGHQKSFAILL